MASFAAARSAFRSSSGRHVASKFASSASKPKPSSFFSLPKQTKLPSAPRILRSPIESSFCVESLMPMHSVTAAAVMNSMLSISRSGYGWLAEACNDDA